MTCRDECFSNYKYYGLLFFCSLVSNGQTCTSPVYNNSVGITIRGPCPSSQVFAVFTSNSTVKFTCLFDHDGSYLTFWKVTDIPTNLQFWKKHKEWIDYVVSSGATGIVSFSIMVEKNCYSAECDKDSDYVNLDFVLKIFVILIPAQPISFGK